MRLAYRIMAACVFTGVVLLGAITSTTPGVDPEPFPYHKTVALGAATVDPEPFPWQSDDRIKVRYPWLSPDSRLNQL